MINWEYHSLQLLKAGFISWFHSAACLEVGGVLYLKKNRMLDGQIDQERFCR